MTIAASKSMIRLAKEIRPSMSNRYRRANSQNCLSRFKLIHVPPINSDANIASNSDADQADSDPSQINPSDVEALFEKYGRRVLAFLSTMGIRGADADDIHQQAWIKIIRSLEQSPFEGNFRAWLFKIVRNTAIDAKRKKTPELIDPTTSQSIVATHDSPDQSMIDSDYQRQLSTCLERLPEDARTLIQGRLAGDNYQTIAHRMKLDVTRAHRIFFDAKRSLTQCLEQQEAE